MSARKIDNDKAAAYFDCTDGERASFEAGIKLGALFHQFTGIPINLENREAVERTIEKCVRVQPFVEEVSVSIDLSKAGLTPGRYGYTTLDGDMMDVRLVVSYGRRSIRCKMHYVDELSYPLMYIEGLDEV